MLMLIMISKSNFSYVSKLASRFSVNKAFTATALRVSRVSGLYTNIMSAIKDVSLDQDKVNRR